MKIYALVALLFAAGCPGHASPGPRGADPVPPAVDDDPACVAAADHGAEILANDVGATGAERVDTVARARAAILTPCLATRYSDGLLECLTDPEMTEHFGICGFNQTGAPDWEALRASLDAAGFGPRD